MRKTTLLPLVVSAAMFVVSGCDSLGAQSTCQDFNDASPQEQAALVQGLVQAAEGGARNPLREANAVMQISTVCQQPAAADKPVAEIAF